MTTLVRGGILAVLLVSLGCSYAMEEIGLFKRTEDLGPLPFGGPLLDDVRRSQPIDFALVKDTALRSCASCHATMMSSPDRVLQKTDEIQLRIGDPAHLPSGVRPMPPPASGFAAITDCEREIVQAWLENEIRGESLSVQNLPACSAGAETAEETETKPLEEQIPLEELEATFENVKARILEPKCFGCHTPGGKRTAIDTVEALVSQYLLADKAENSVIYQIVVPGLYWEFMPPKRSGQPPLSEAETEFIKRWIDSRSAAEKTP